MASILALSALLAAPAALADTVAIPPASGLPWTDPAHNSPLELLASRIASRIAGRSVRIVCEGDTDWRALAAQLGFDPARELGFVSVAWTTVNGVPVGGPVISNVAQLGPYACYALQQFAVAVTKPTKCPQPAAADTFARRRRDVQAQPAGPPGPCFAGDEPLPVRNANAFWATYGDTAMAMLTLAHEAVHLGGVVGGVLPSGYAVGDPQAEAKAQCYGLQWLPWVAQQLGDTPDDALAIAQWAYTVLYPRYRGTSYWSPQCVPGGALDTRPAGTTAWP